MRRNAATLLGAMVLVCLASVAGAANKYPPGPGGTCPDSLIVPNIQNPAAPCHPATLDTVLGVGGIITAFDAKPTGFGFYIQNRQAVNEWSGVDVFTGSANYQCLLGLALGDSVVVYGTTQEFQGETEIEGPDVTTSSDDIIVRKVSSGNTLPPFVANTTNTFRHLPTNPNEKYEGMLARINAASNGGIALRVARTSLTGGLPFNSFLLVNATGPATDSVHVDGNTLTTYPPPAVGTDVTFVQGIFHQRTNTVSSFRIQLRNGNDIGANTAPQIVEVYPMEDNVVRVIFDRDVELTSSEEELNYSLATARDILTATRVSGTTVHLTIDNTTSPVADGAIDGLTVDGVKGEVSGLPLTGGDPRNFVTGVLEPSVVQAADPAGLAGNPCEDRSRYAGPGTSIGALRVSIRGTATAAYKSGNLYYVGGASGGARNGVAVFAPLCPLQVGNRYLVVGSVQEFGGGPVNGRETEVVSTVLVSDEGPAAMPFAIVQPVAVLADTTCDNAAPSGVSTLSHLSTGEDYEGVLVMARQVRVTENRNAGQSFFVAGPAPGHPDTILIANQNNNSYTFNPDSLQRVDVRGILTSNSLSSRRFRINPRHTLDIKLVTTTGVEDFGSSLSFAVSPNPARTPRLTFALPRLSDVDLSVYDVFGRRVATLVRGQLEEGDHSYTWEGRNAAGKLVGSGMFFYKLSVGGVTQTVRGIKLN